MRTALNIVSGGMRSPFRQASAISSGVMRSIQAALNPTDFAPIASHGFDETKIGRCNPQARLDQRIGFGAWFEDPLRVDADRGIEDFVQGGIADQRGQHVGAAVGKYRHLVVPQVGKRLSRVAFDLNASCLKVYCDRSLDCWTIPCLFGDVVNAPGRRHPDVKLGEQQFAEVRHANAGVSAVGCGA
jgi:hypothetical protein